MSESIHVLSSGSYSDYCVHAAVRGTKEEAEALALRLNGGDATKYDPFMVEEIPLVAADVEPQSVL